MTRLHAWILKFNKARSQGHRKIQAQNCISLSLSLQYTDITLIWWGYNFSLFRTLQSAICPSPDQTKQTNHLRYHCGGQLVMGLSFFIPKSTYFKPVIWLWMPCYPNSHKQKWESFMLATIYLSDKKKNHDPSLIDYYVSKVFGLLFFHLIPKKQS